MSIQATPESAAHDMTAVLVDAIQHLSLARRRGDIQEIVRRAARQMTGADGATFVLRDGDKCFYADEDAIAPLWKGQRFPLSACVSGWVMTHREATAIPDIYADPRVPQDAYRPTFVRSLAMVPVRSIDPFGAIGNYWAAPHAPTAAEMSALQSLADATAVAMENVTLAENAVTDELTGLLNRRGFFEVGEVALEAARAADEDCLVLFVDVNGLKGINDRLGHEAGDAAIAATAATLRRELGEDAVIGRVGGDEFAAVVRGSRPLAAGPRVEFAAGPRVTGSTAISLGIAESAGSDRRSLDELLASADERMYGNKPGVPRNARFRKPAEG